VLGLAAELDLERGRPDDAAASLDQALALVARSDDETLLPELCMRGARSGADQVDAARATGRAADTGAAGERAAAFAARVHDMVRAREQRGVAPTPRALAADAQAAAERSRVTRSDPQLWAQAAARWEVAREAYPQAYCRWREAEAVVESGGGRARATACLDRAWQICAALDASPLAARIEGLARRARLELSPAVVDEPAPAADVASRLGLTAREVEVLGHLAAGSSDREIAETLFISKKTVSVHVSNVLRKLSVARRVEAGKIGQAHGLGLTSS
jgi:ATP/maltotriose-dependent transcriptional regulator MalT